MEMSVLRKADPATTGESRARLRRRVRRGVLLGAGVGAVSLASAGPASAGVLFSDGFEESDFVRWSQALTRGDGRAVIDSSHARTGSLAAQLSTTAARTSKAYLRATFGTARVVTVRGHFAMIRQPGGRRAVPVLRLLAPSSRPIVSVDRAAGPRGALRVGLAGRAGRPRGARRPGRGGPPTLPP